MFDYHQRQIIPGKLYEITDRTLTGEHLFVSQLYEKLVKSIAFAQKVSNIKIFAYAVMSNHYHLLVSADGPEQMGQFLREFHCRSARAVNKYWGRAGRVWARRASVIRVSDEPAMQVRRLRYILSNGVKETGAKHPATWGGPHVAHYFDLGYQEAVGLMSLFKSEATTIADVHKGLLGLEDKHKIRVSPLRHLASLSEDEYLSEMRHLMNAVGESPLDTSVGLEGHQFDTKAAQPEHVPATRRPRTRQWSKIVENPKVSNPDPEDEKPKPFRAFAHDVAIRKRLEEKREQFVSSYRLASRDFRNGERLEPKLPAYSFLPPGPWLIRDAAVDGLWGRIGDGDVEKEPKIDELGV